MTGLPNPMRRRPRLLALLGLGAVLSLFGLDVVYVLHLIDEHACPVRETGDPFDCYICTAHLRLGPEPPLVFTPPLPEPGEIIAPPDASMMPPARAPHLAVARAPPACIL
jgi:hypothetical protein